LKVSKPSIGASFQAPPNAEIHPNRLPIVTMTSARGQVWPKRSSSARIAMNTAAQPSATQTPIVIRLRASFIGTPMIPNCIGIVYLAWSFLAQEVLPELGRGALEAVDQAPVDEPGAGRAEVPVQDRLGDATEGGAGHRRADVLGPGEPLVGGVLVHAPRRGVHPGERADDDGAEIAHRPAV